ncbi:MAG: tRNA (adenosine(37)-N6)-threonylcarbamoyltransferase complex transferase subunit TsaD [Pseudomonadota bacterium]
MAKPVTVLGIESSCDDTAAAVVARDDDGPHVQSSVVYSQTDLHARFGGVVPEIAARAHAERLDLCIEEALKEAKTPLFEVDAVAVTCGPGLIGGVVSGVMTAKGIAAATGLPLYGINHLAGHALTPRLTNNVEFPYLLLLISGGHCQFQIVHDPLTFERLGGTIDDAPGEAFDKVARLVGLPQPGGPAIEIAAQSGDPSRFQLPRPLLDRPGCDMSFSGLKTAALRARDTLMTDNGGLNEQDQADLAASFQAAVRDVLVEKGKRALEIYRQSELRQATICVAGGVAANQTIRAGLEQAASEYEARFVAPPLRFCTDNAAMIAWAAIEQMDRRAPDGMDLAARPRMPLDTQSTSMLGSGKKGAKA